MNKQILITTISTLLLLGNWALAYEVENKTSEQSKTKDEYADYAIKPDQQREVVQKDESAKKQATEEYWDKRFKKLDRLVSNVRE